MILTPPEEDSLGKMYGWATKALGSKRVRHEGKVTGLAAMGEPTRAAELMARYRVDDEGRIHSDLSGDRAIYAFMRALKRNSAERTTQLLSRRCSKMSCCNPFGGSLRKIPHDISGCRARLRAPRRLT